jgi:hypothetical protein
MQKDPQAVADAANHPVNECDLHARHLWLVRNDERISARLMADPEYCEPKAAGWWCWGINCWIGSGFCDGSGPWSTEKDADEVDVFIKVGNAGQGVNRQLPREGTGAGVNRKLPHIGDAGVGVNRKLPREGTGTGVNQARLDWLNDWFAKLSDSLREARICCGDWERICSVGSMTRNGTCAVLLDPPYSQTAAVYASDSSTVAHDVRKWCIENGSNPLLRIALCGHDTEHNELESLGWTVETWDKAGGYQGADDRERIWFSPHCLKVQKQGELF